MKKSEELRDLAILELTEYINSLSDRHGEKLSYWVRDYVRLLRAEASFNPRKLIRYKRGSIVKAHLGYRIGSEEGGLHYAVVIDNQNALSDATIRILPLTSVKDGTDIESLHHSNIYLGDEIFLRVSEKLEHFRTRNDAEEEALLSRIDEVHAEMVAPPPENANHRVYLAEKRASFNGLMHEVKLLHERAMQEKKVFDALSKMKTGSIALVGQITTISKLRIYDPIYKSGVLNNIKLSDDSLTKIDKKIIELYTKST